MKLSVIIPNYNGIKYLKGCIKALYKQSFKDFQIIIVDNASTDGSCDYVLNQYPSVKLICLNQNYGFCKAVNEGIKDSATDYVVLLNNDTEADEFWLENLVKCIETDEKIFSCCSKMIRYEERDIIDDAGDEYSILGWAYKRGDGESVEKYNMSERVFSSCAGATIYRTSIFKEIGYFHEIFFAYMEDVDISFRANIHGYKNIYCSNALIYHIGSATSGSKYNSFKVKLAARNNIYVTLKNMPLLLFFINLPFLFLGWCIKGFFYSRIGFSKEYLIGTLNGLTSLNKITKVKYKNENLVNYLKIEVIMLKNAYRYFNIKFTRLIKYFRNRVKKNTVVTEKYVRKL